MKDRRALSGLVSLVMILLVVGAGALAPSLVRWWTAPAPFRGNHTAHFMIDETYVWRTDEVGPFQRISQLWK